MSAFVVTHSTIAAIVTYAERRFWSCAPPPPHVGVGTVNIRDIDPDRIGQALLAENIRSVNHRYRRTDNVPTYRHVPTYSGAVSSQETRTLRPLDVIKLCQCLEYQSCEHPEWEASWARSFLQRVADTAVNDLPGYDDAPWGLYDPSSARETPGSADEQLIIASLPRVFATLSHASMSDSARRNAVAALLRSCTVSDVLMHLRDACLDAAKRFPPDGTSHRHYALAANAIQTLRETTDI